MSARYIDTRDTLESPRRLRVSCRVGNDSREAWAAASGLAIGWQIYDPAGGAFLAEGDWLPLNAGVAPGESVPVEIPVELPVEVDAGKVSADYRNGLLVVALPKAESARPRQVPITVR